ncbi:type II secretion system GspH family protein [Patescibacteria group bacterium]|nr:type II secretion system GspH family protein [Patescibacteria group bacterium]
MKQAARGFTLIELLVVVAAMSLIGVYTFANYKSFGDDQNFKNATSDIQGILRSAQTSASTNTKCSTQYGATWQVIYTDAKTLNLQCKESGAASFTAKKTLTLGTNITVSASGNNISCPVPSVVTFTPVSGTIDLGAANCTRVTFTLSSTKVNGTKTVVVEQKGGIYVQ